MNFFERAEKIAAQASKAHPTKSDVARTYGIANSYELKKIFFQNICSGLWLKHLPPHTLEVENVQGTTIRISETQVTYKAWPPAMAFEKLILANDQVAIEHIIQSLKNIARETPPNEVNPYIFLSLVQVLSQLEQNSIDRPLLKIFDMWLSSRGFSLVESHISNALIDIAIKNWAEEKLLLLVKSLISAKWASEKGIISKKDQSKSFCRLDTYWFDNTFSEANTLKLHSKLGSKFSKLLLSKLSQAILREKNDNFSYIWRPAIENSSQNIQEYEYKNKIITLLRVIIDYSKSSDANLETGNLLKSRHSTLKRFAIYCIEKNFEKERSHIHYIYTQKFLLNPNYHHELYMLAKKKFPEFSKVDQNSYVESARSLDGKWADKSKAAQLNLNLRYRWLKIAADHGHVIATGLTKKLKDAKQGDMPHPEYNSYTEIFWGNRSKISPDQILQMTWTELKKEISSASPSDDPRKNSIHGLQNAFGEAVKQNPGKFLSDIAEFQSIDIEFLFITLSTLDQMWVNGAKFDWPHAIELAKQGISFLKIYPVEEHAYRACTISRFLKSGINTDTRLMPEECILSIETLAVDLLKITAPRSDSSDNDYFSKAINSPKGCAVDFYINFCLNRARANDKIEKDRDSLLYLLEPIDRELEDRQNFECRAILGAFLPQMAYFSFSWLKLNLPKIFNTDSDGSASLPALSGYQYVPTTYKAIYELMYETNTYSKILAKGESQYVERISRDIALAYTQDWLGYENLMNSVIQNTSCLSAIIKFFAKLDNEKDISKFRTKVISLWERTISQSPNNLGECASLVHYIDSKAKEPEKLLMAVANHVNLENSFDFIEKLLSLSKTSNASLGRPLISFLSLGLHFDIESALTLLEHEYERGSKEIADLIAEKLALLGHFGQVKRIYERFNN